MWHKDTVRFAAQGIEVPGRKDRIVSDHTRPDLNLASKRQGWSTLNVDKIDYIENYQDLQHSFLFLLRIIAIRDFSIESAICYKN